MKSLKTNIYFKIATIFFIGLILLIPTSMIENLIFEREGTQKEAISEVSSKWANQQTISGPFISIPYIKYVKEFTKKDSTTKIIQLKEYIHILPSELKITGKINPEQRNRGIYEIVVYNSKINISGKFINLNVGAFEIPLNDIQFEKAYLSLGIDDLRGI